MVVLRRLQCSRAEVECLHHTACGHDTQHTVEERVAVSGGSVEAVRQGLVACHIQGDVLQRTVIRSLRVYITLPNKNALYFILPNGKKFKIPLHLKGKYCTVYYLTGCCSKKRFKVGVWRGWMSTQQGTIREVLQPNPSFSIKIYIYST